MRKASGIKSSESVFLPQWSNKEVQCMLLPFYPKVKVVLKACPKFQRIKTWITFPFYIYPKTRISMAWGCSWDCQKRKAEHCQRWPLCFYLIIYVETWFLGQKTDPSLFCSVAVQGCLFSTGLVTTKNILWVLLELESVAHPNSDHSDFSCQCPRGQWPGLHQKKGAITSPSSERHILIFPCFKEFKARSQKWSW